MIAAIIFPFTIFFSAFLLFSVQPMAGKLILPLFGGASGVWNTCMLFFQVTLLAGYAYAHVVNSRLGERGGALVHLLLWGGAVWLAMGGIPSGVVHSDVVGVASSPNLWILWLLVSWLGVPFLMVSTTASLLQSWYARFPNTKNPYVLYAASNLGSFFALLCYPLVIEPFFHLEKQYLYWSTGLFACGVLIACSSFLFLFRFKPEPAEQENRSESIGNDESVSWSQRVRWIGFAFVPSSLLLGVTAYLSTDVAAMPLLWVIPLSLYLLSFVIVFSDKFVMPKGASRVLAFLGVIALIGILLDSTSLWFVPVNLLFMFVAALVCHGRASAERPSASRLTEFYLWISVGGALGGVFNSLIAPQIFPDIFEYPLAILLACYCRPSFGREDTVRRRLLLGLLVGAVTFILFGLLHFTDLLSGKAALVIAVTVPTLLSYRLVRRPKGYAVALAMMFLAGEATLTLSKRSEMVFRDRTFYGVVKVKEDRVAGMRMLYHGSTVHGLQSLEEERANIALAYFSETGPMGDVFELHHTLHAPDSRVAIIGLGVGTLATYAREGETWDFFEIDPLILDLAKDPAYFTYLSRNESRARFRYFLGDARVKLTLSDATYDLVIMDAFSSDSIPAHLITKEAVELFWERLGQKGLLVYNISNRYFDFVPVLSAISRETDSHLVVVSDLGEGYGKPENLGKAPSSWAVLVKDPELLSFLKKKGWVVPPKSSQDAWTDDFHNLLSVLR